MTISTDAGKTGLFDPSNVAITGGTIGKGRRPAVSMLGRPIQAQVATAAVSGSPTITDLASGTSGIASAVAVGKDDPCFTYTGPTLQAWTSNSTYIATNQSLANYMVVTFCTDAPILELVMNRFNSRIFIEVDEQPALTNHISLDSAGSKDLISVDFGGVRKARNIRVSGYNMPFGGINVGPNDSYWAVVDERPLMAFMGDSYTQGTGANAQTLVYAATCARLLNYQYWLEGIGSTGWTSPGSNAPDQRIAVRMNQLQRRNSGVSTNVQPDVLVWALGYNDAPSGTAAAIGAGFDAAYAAATTKPTALIGPWTPLGTTTNLDAVRTVMQQKQAQYGIAYYDDIRNYVNSVNKTVLTGGDNVHPVQVGHDFLGFRIAQDLRAAGY